jgi:hypothetical protein
MFLRYMPYWIGLLSLVACETTPKTPEAFLKARFPQLTEEIQWDSSKTNEIGAFFSDSTGIGYEVYFDRAGHFQKLYTYLNANDLPAKTETAILQKYPNYKLAVLSLVEAPKSKFYHAELATDKDYITLEVDDVGNFLSEKVEPLSEQELRNAEEEGVDDDLN